MRSHKILAFLSIGFVFLFLTSFSDLEQIRAHDETEATLSGIITHEGIPVEGVTVFIGWEGSGDQMITGSDGMYHFSGVPMSVFTMIQVRPPSEMRLAYRNWGINVDGDLIKNFDLLDGYRLQGKFTIPTGAVFQDYFWLSVSELSSSPPEGEWEGDQVKAGYFDLVLAPGVYTLSMEWRPIPYFMPMTKVDLRISDISSLEVRLVDELPPAFEIDPPVAELIHVGEANTEGIATVVGQAGAVTPLSAVAIVNIDAETVITTTSDSNGSFSARLFAPPGSSLTIKVDQKGERVKSLWQLSKSWNTGDFSLMNPLPGVTISVGDPPLGDGRSQEFTSAGRFEGVGWAGWWVNGVILVPHESGGPGLSVQPGDTITMSMQLHATSPAFICTDPNSITLDLNFNLEYLFDAQGDAKPWGIWFESFLSTPTGIPIEHEGESEKRGLGGLVLTDLACESAHTVMSIFRYRTVVPGDLLAGIYYPEIYITGDIPLFLEYPFVKVWYDEPPIAHLPILHVGVVNEPHIPWILLGNYPVNGLQGLVALQDAGKYNLVNRVIYPPAVKVIPRLDERTGEPLVYRLEPGSNWLSSTDRRFAPPPHIKLDLPSGEMTIEVLAPDGSLEVLGPAPILQTTIRTPTLPDGTQVASGTGQIGDMFHLTTLQDVFNYEFKQYGLYTLFMYGWVNDIYGNPYLLESTYKVAVARILDLDPAELPTTPYIQGDAFAPGLHIFPPLPAHVDLQVVHLPNSDPQQAITYTVSGDANQFGYFQPPAGTEFRFDTPGEFRVKIRANYEDPDGTLWVGILTWGNVVEGQDAQIEAHGRRGMDYHSNIIDDMPAWFYNNELPPEKIGIENYYPYYNGDVHWGSEIVGPGKGDSIHSIITMRDLTGIRETYYDVLRDHFPRATSCFRWPPDDCSLAGLNARIAIGEAPMFLTTVSGADPEANPDEIDLWGYWYGSSERPDVHVREIVSDDNMGTAYWRFNDTYGYQIGEPATGDQAGDIKWEFGGIVFRVPSQGINQYGIYSSMWVLLPQDDPYGPRVTAPYQDAVGAGVNGGPIMTLLGKDIDVLFLPKGVRPGDILKLGDTVSFSGHVGPPLNSRVEVTITSPGGVVRNLVRHANKIGWVYDPSFDFVADEAGRWTVNVFIEHDQLYPPTGVVPQSHNTGTVLGTNGQYEFYVVDPGTNQIWIMSPQPGFIRWDNGGIEPIRIHGQASGAELVYYTIHDKGIVMKQDSVAPDAYGYFTITYDAKLLHEDFPMLSLTAHEGQWEGLADEVSIRILAVGGGPPKTASVTLIGEEIFIQSDHTNIIPIYLPFAWK